MRLSAWVRVALLALPLAAVPYAAGRAQEQHGGEGEGLRVFKSANCVGCHKWFGGGGGGYGGAAANLRETALTRDQIIETVRCGRPGTGMPTFEEGSYSDGRCYGLKASDLSEGEKPPGPNHYLSQRDINAVADYVMTHIKGHGAPTYEECLAFFGHSTHVCAEYPHDPASAKAENAAAAAPGHGTAVESASDANAPAGDAAAGDAPAHHTMVETAPDANAPKP